MTAEVQTRERHLRPVDKWVLFAMAGTSGAGIVAHTFGPVEMRYSAPFVVLPSMIVLVGVVFARQRQPERFGLIADRVVAGALWGLVATFTYDLVRPPLVALFDFDFNPFGAMPVFGRLILGDAERTLLGDIVGWGYHFWNGIGFGIMLALVRPRGGWFVGMAWGLILEAIMLSVYPEFVGAQLDDAGFLVTGIVGHAVWGAVLGWCLSRWGPRV